MLVPIVYLPSLNLPKIPMHSRSALSFLARASTTWIVCVDESGSKRLRSKQLDSTVFLKVWSKHWPACYCSAMNWLESPFYPSKICWIVNFSFQTVKYTFSAPFWIWRLGYLVTRRGCLVCACAKKKCSVISKNGGNRGNGCRYSRASINFFGLCEEKIRSKKGTHILPSLIFISSYFWRFYST